MWFRDDRGSATVWAAVTGVTLCAVFAVVLAMGQAVSARHRAGGAADLAALAAADRALEGQKRACAVARRVAAAQSARLVRCAVRGEVADVSVEVRLGPYAPQLRSRAGPPAIPDDAERGPAPTTPKAPTGPAQARASGRYVTSPADGRPVRGSRGGAGPHSAP